jgi:superfamily II DNA helicase RecQ
MTSDYGDEFGLDDDEDLELQALADKHDRKHARSESGATDEPPSKVLKTTDSDVNQVALGVATNVLNNRFKLPGFRLKQSLAISRILSGGSSVVVFPTGMTCYQDAEHVL